VAIIMDGNGRWASGRGKPRHFGHRKGVDTVRTIVKAARDRGIEYLTLYSFSTENWSRPAEEVNELFKLLRMFIRRDLAELHQNGVRVRVIGQRDNLPADIADLLSEAETLTRFNTAQTLIVAFNYGSRSEIVSAVQKLAVRVAAGELRPDQISEEMLSESLDTFDIPDPDLILRTAGEFRLSNFLMWQASYSEFVFNKKLWPDFTAQDLDMVLADYASRKRKFGGLAVSVENDLTGGQKARLIGN
jgi:undecaprenyl diphosphate synthase